ncbi:MAG: CoA-binding protein [Bacteroidota bacterium]|nr:CoA-binding protein [Bacteroidota bacterium]
MGNVEKVLVIGASENPEGYAYKATKMLTEFGHNAIAFGLKPGKIGDTIITTSWPQDVNIDTVTMYVGKDRQADFIPKVLALKPHRIIFNPGTENKDFKKLAEVQGIKCEYACTLVLLATQQF